MSRAEQTPARDEHLSPLQLSIYADGETPAAEREQVAAHLAACATCAARLESIREVGVTIARLERTTPLAAVFERTLAAARRIEQASGGVARERIGGERRGNVRLREVSLVIEDEPSQAPRASDLSRRRPARWRPPFGNLLPMLAALLLITLAGTLLVRSSLTLTTHIANATPTATLPPNQVVNDTNVQINRYASLLPFKPLTPTFLPGGVGEPNIKPPTTGDSTLDIAWPVAHNAATILTLREQPASQRGDNFTMPQTQVANLTWQVGEYTRWQPMSFVAHRGWVGVEQRRSGATLLLQAQPAPGASLIQVETLLRFISLSIDIPYTTPKVTIQAPASNETLRTIAQVQGTGGNVWSWDVTLSNDQVDQNATITNAQGLKVTEVTGEGGAGVLLDEQHRIYQNVPGPTAYQVRPRALTEIAYDAGSLLASGFLWNLTPTPQRVNLYDGRQILAYDLYRVDTSLPEHVYVDASSGAVVAVWVNTSSPIAPGGSAGEARYVDTASCAPYTITYQWLLYATPTATTFAQPSLQGFTPGAVSLPFQCGQ